MPAGPLTAAVPVGEGAASNCEPALASESLTLVPNVTVKQHLPAWTDL